MRHHVPITVAPNDEFDMYGLELPLADWAYILDEPRIVYGPGWYPFHRPTSRSAQNPAAPLLNHAVATGKTEPASVRMSPNLANYSWRNEYVRLVPIDHRAQARITLLSAGKGSARWFAVSRSRSTFARVSSRSPSGVLSRSVTKPRSRGGGRWTC